MRLRPTPSLNEQTYGLRFVDYLPYYWQGVCYLRTGDFNSAIRMFNIEERQGAVLKAALATFFAHDGAKLLAFERATEPLGNGRVPSKAACSDYINKKLPPIGGPNLLVSITERIPDPALQQAWKADVAGKHLFLAACDTNAKIPVQAAVTIRDNQNKLRAVAGKHGIML